VSAHPFGSGEAENLNRFDRSMIMSKSKSASAQNVSSVVKCRAGDLAMYISGCRVGRIVEVIKYYGVVETRDGVLTNAWEVRHSDHDPSSFYFQEDAAMMPIRPGDLKETEETDEILSLGVKQS
jgi:hypothetical protein